MSVFNENISIKLKEVGHMVWDVSAVSVAPRPHHALVFRLSGSACFTHDTLQAVTNCHDVFYMPADYAYDAVYPEENEILVVHFESDLTAEMENYPLQNPHLIAALFQRLYEIWQRKEEGYYYSALSVLCEILANISVQQAPSFPAETQKAFEQAVSYLENHYTSAELTIEQLAAKANMSNTYFRKIFFARYGMTPLKYLISKRLVHAEKLLSTGKYTICQVAEQSGFSDVKYFSRVIKKEYGVPPSGLYSHTTPSQSSITSFH